MAFVVLLAACLRFWGITWGLPERIDLHPDEIHYVITHAKHVSWSDPDPRFLNYPSFLAYATALVDGLLRAVGAVREEWQITVVGRSVIAAFGALTAGAVFLLAQEMGAVFPAALLAALFVAILPLHVWESHIAVTDVLMTFWIVVTLLASLRLLRRARPADLALAGAALGLAVGSKYTAALAGIAPVLALLLAGRPARETARGFAVLGCSALAACFLVTPYSFLHFRELLAAMRFESAHVHGHHPGFSVPAEGWQYRKYLYQIAAAWPFSYGFALYICAVAGTLWAIVRHRRTHLPVLGFAALFFGVTGSWTFTPLRYYLPVVVLGALFAGLWLGEWLAGPGQGRRRFAAAAVALALGYTVVFTATTTARFANDTRVQAAMWLRQNAESLGTVWLAGDPHYLATLAEDQDISGHGEAKVLKYLDRGEDPAAPDTIEITSLLYNRHYRHGKASYRRRYDHLRSGRSDYVLVKRFESGFLNKCWYVALDPMFEGYFISPTLEFYQRRSASTTAVPAGGSG